MREWKKSGLVLKYSMQVTRSHATLYVGPIGHPQFQIDVKKSISHQLLNFARNCTVFTCIPVKMVSQKCCNNFCRYVHRSIMVYGGGPAKSVV